MALKIASILCKWAMILYHDIKERIEYSYEKKD